MLVQSPAMLRRTQESSPFSSCDTSDTESCTLPVNSASLLRRQQNSQKPSPVRGHVLRKAKVGVHSTDWVHCWSYFSLVKEGPAVLCPVSGGEIDIQNQVICSTSKSPLCKWTCPWHQTWNFISNILKSLIMVTTYLMNLFIFCFQ